MKLYNPLKFNITNLYSCRYTSKISMLLLTMVLTMVSIDTDDDRKYAHLKKRKPDVIGCKSKRTILIGR